MTPVYMLQPGDMFFYRNQLFQRQIAPERYDVWIIVEWFEPVRGVGYYSDMTQVECLHPGIPFDGPGPAHRHVGGNCDVH